MSQAVGPVQVCAIVSKAHGVQAADRVVGLCALLAVVLAWAGFAMSKSYPPGRTCLVRGLGDIREYRSTWGL